VARDAPLGWQEHVADLDALVTLWGTAPATILGYSWGGLLALLYSATHPDRVARLALVSPAPMDWKLREEFGRRFAERQARPEMVQAREALRSSGLRQRDPDRYWRRAFELSVAGYFMDPARAEDLTPFRVTARTQQAVLDSLRRSDLTSARERLCGLRIPALVLCGRHDPIPLEAAEQVAECLAARMEVLERSGHVPHVEEPERFVGLLDAYLPHSTGT
jgi:pimeloyl-ACP methyl ester carboxylesterase